MCPSPLAWGHVPLRISSSSAGTTVRTQLATGAATACRSSSFRRSNPVTATSRGPAQVLVGTPEADFGVGGTHFGLGGAYYANLVVSSAAVAPSGEIALLYNGYDGLLAVFLDSSGAAGAPPDGGTQSITSAAGLSVKNIVNVASPYSDGADPAHVIWSNASQSFVVSWATNSGEGVSKFTVDGQAVAGGVTMLPTDVPNGAVASSTEYIGEGSAGESGNLLGVEYGSSVSGNRDPSLTVLDAVGNQVGSSVRLATLSAVSGYATLAGTAQGFVCVYDSSGASQPVVEVFAPSSSAGVAADAGAFPTFSFTGGTRTDGLRAIADDVGTGGSGGVGVAIQYPTSLSFAYVQANGVDHEGPVQVFPILNGGGTRLSVTNFNGSFVVTLYDDHDNSDHETQIAVSGCPQ